jgi:putative membrane protein
VIEAAEPDWQWLSPRSLIVRPVTDLIRLIPLLAGALFFGTAHGGGGYWTLGLAALAIVASIVRWCTTRYRVTAERIYLRHGLLNQKVLSVSRDRIRSVDFSAHLIYRFLGLRKVSVGTGRSDRHEGGSLHLDALTLADAEALRALLLTAVAEVAQEEDQPPERELVRLRPGWVRYAPLTLTGLVIIGVVLGSAAQLINDLRVNLYTVAPVYHLGVRFTHLPVDERVLDVVVTVLVLVAVLSILGYVAVFWNFRLVRHGDALRVSRGLLTTRTITIDTRRLRGAELSEPLLLRAAGGARCLAITTGLRVGEGAEHGGSLLLPPAPNRVARQVTAAVLATTAIPGDFGQLVTGELIQHGPAARRRRYLRALTAAVVLIAAGGAGYAAGWWPVWVLLATLVTLPLAVALAQDRYRSLGHRLTDHWLITRTGTFVRRRSVLSTDGIIGWRIHQSWFQRRQGLVSLAATTAAGHQHYVAHDIPAAQAVALAAQATSRLMSPFLT